MTGGIVWRPLAQADLLDLYDWIADQADPRTSYAYTAKIEARIDALLVAPEQGSPRDDLAPGARTVAYRRRTVIVYRLIDGRIEVLAIAHGGRDLAGMFGDEDRAA